MDKKINVYKINKEKIREKAIEWQYNYNNQNYSYEELLEMEEIFWKYGKRYGLLKEFRENGII